VRSRGGGEAASGQAASRRVAGVVERDLHDRAVDGGECVGTRAVVGVVLPAAQWVALGGFDTSPLGLLRIAERRCGDLVDHDQPVTGHQLLQVHAA
jgi:hypothetical protein